MIILEMAQPSGPHSLPHFNPVRERELRRHIGDYTLFMTGLFRERVEHLSVTGYYIREGQCSYGTPDLPFFRRLVTEW